MPCDAHRSRKKGDCPSCKTCKCCPAPTDGTCDPKVGFHTPIPIPNPLARKPKKQIKRTVAKARATATKADRADEDAKNDDDEKDADAPKADDAGAASQQGKEKDKEEEASPAVGVRTRPRRVRKPSAKVSGMADAAVLLRHPKRPARSKSPTPPAKKAAAAVKSSGAKSGKVGGGRAGSRSPPAAGGGRSRKRRAEAEAQSSSSDEEFDDGEFFGGYPDGDDDDDDDDGGGSSSEDEQEHRHHRGAHSRRTLPPRRALLPQYLSPPRPVENPPPFFASSSSARPPPPASAGAGTGTGPGFTGGAAQPTVISRPHPPHTNPTALTGIYAPLVRLRLKRDTDTSPVVTLPPRTVGGLRDQIERMKQCNCKRSNCLKLYCECFASAIHCSPMCNCHNCHNGGVSVQSVRERSKVVAQTLERNPNAFRPRALAIAGAAMAAATMAGQGGVTGSSPAGGDGMIGSPPGSPRPLTSAAAANAAAVASAAEAAVAARQMSSPSTHLNDPNESGPRGCNCRKSHCLKKYCECFHATVYCNPAICRCTDCQNVVGNPQREKLLQRRRSQAEAAANQAVMMFRGRRIGAGMVAMGMHGRHQMVGGFPDDAAGNPEDMADGSPHHMGGGMVGDGSGAAAAAAITAGAAAGGVDVFLPPSSYAIPMKLGNGVEVPGLSFGTASQRPEPAPAGAPPPTPSSRPTPRQHNIASRISPAGGRLSQYAAVPPPPLRYYAGDKIETALERDVRIATDGLNATLDSMRSIVDKEKAQRAAVSAAARGRGEAVPGTPVKAARASLAAVAASPSSSAAGGGGGGGPSPSSQRSPGAAAAAAPQAISPASLFAPGQGVASRKRPHGGGHGDAPPSPRSALRARATEREARACLNFVRGGLERIRKATDLAEERTVKYLEGKQRLPNEEKKGKEEEESKDGVEELKSKGKEEERDDKRGNKENIAEKESKGEKEEDEDGIVAENKKEATKDSQAGPDDENPSPNADDYDSDTEAALLCGEVLPPEPKRVRLTPDAERELMLLAVQDAALLHELARIVRERALAMGAERIRRAAAAKAEAERTARAEAVS